MSEYGSDWCDCGKGCHLDAIDLRAQLAALKEPGALVMKAADDHRLTFTTLRNQLAAALKERDEARQERDTWQASCANADEVLAKRDAQLDHTLRELDKARSENMCDACAGAGEPTSGPPCMCGGTGKMSDAACYLREQMVKAWAERNRLRAALVPFEENLDAYHAALGEDDVHNDVLLSLLAAIRARALPEATP